jgi:hypothetical protein
MAFPNTAVFELRTTGDDLNGGGFDSASAGVDYSQQDSAQVTIDGATITMILDATNRFVLTGYTVSADDVGNCVCIRGGTCTPGRYFIDLVDTGLNTWRVDRSAGSIAQTGTGRMGGAAKFLGSINNSSGSSPTARNKVWIKSGTYTLTTSTAGDGGPTSNISANIEIEGYNTTRGDGSEATAPVIDCAAFTGMIVFAFGASAVVVCRYCKVDGQGANTGFNLSTRGLFSNLIAYDCLTGFSGGRPKNCLAWLCTTGFSSSNAENCGAWLCGIGYNQSNTDTTTCWAAECTSTGFSLSTGAGASNCVAYDNDGDGFDVSSSSGQTCIDCVSVNNGGYAYDTGTAAANSIAIRLLNCAAYNNTSGVINTVTPVIYDVDSLTGDPYDNGASEDFTPNNVSGEGAELRGNAISAYGQTGYLDRGCVQHQDSASGGNTIVGSFAWVD